MSYRTSEKFVVLEIDFHAVIILSTKEKIIEIFKQISMDYENIIIILRITHLTSILLTLSAYYLVLSLSVCK
jgi:hypothetical protein